MVMKKGKIYRGLIGAFMGLLALTMLVPLLNILAKSISDPALVHQMRGYDILPKGFSLIHYEVILSRPIVLRSIVNSVGITLTGVILNMLLTSSAAYVLTRPGFLGKRPLMYFFIVMMIVDPGIIQEYFLIKKLGLLDNLFSMVLYKSVNVYYLIILMRFMENIPSSIIEAAKIDGAGHMRILSEIVLPLCKAPLLTIGMFYGVYRWNEFFRSSIFLTSKNNTVLQVLLRQFVVQSDTQVILGAADILANNQVSRIDNGALKAATIVVAVLPILLAYPVILRYYTANVLGGSVKE